MRFSMPMPRNLLLCALILALTAWAAAAIAAVRIYPGATDKPADPGFIYNRTIFDCQPADSLTITVTTAVTLSDSTIGRESLIGSYPCAPWLEAGPELIYKLNVAAPLNLTGILRDNVFDLDLFLLNDCDSDSCLVGESVNFSADLDPGIYYLVVDTPSIDSNNQPDTFNLALTARPLGLPEAACIEAEAEANFITCANDTFSVPGPHDLSGQPNLVSVNECGTTPKTAGERWYALTQGPGQQVTVQVSNVAENLDVNLWLFDRCGTDATCLQFVDENVANLGEELTWTNEHPSQNITVYLAVDAVREPAVEPGEDPIPMAFDLQVLCQGSVPTAKTSFGSLKSLYR